MKIIVGVTVILWEITIVYHFFAERAQPTTQQQNLSNDKLANCTLVHGGAAEKFFRRDGK